MGAWSKMMTAPQFAHPQVAHMAALEGKLGVGPEDLLEKEKMLGSPPLNHPGMGHNMCPDDLAAFKALTSNDDDINGTSDLDSDNVSDNDDEVPAGNSLNSSHSKADSGNSSDTFSKTLQSSHKEIMEKLKRQEDDEREEIERELKDAQEKGLIDGEERLRRTSDEEDAVEEDGENSRSSGKDILHKNKDNRESTSRENSPRQMEIKTQRPMGLLAQHGLMTKSHSGLNLSQHHLGHHHQHPHHHHSSSNNNGNSNIPNNNNNSSTTSGIEGNHKTGHDSRAPSRGNNGELNLKVEKREREDSSEREDRDRVRLSMPPTAIDFTHPAFLDRQFSHPLHQPPSPPDIGLMPNGELGTPSGGHHWTFEEQFKQLYELSDDMKRKEFLDDLFAFMQKRGTPVNRIPIMAKQPLDLYELFRLVVSKGGLVEVINKKLWREICKGLNLPSSITSAAFTLRTQYMKYLYPYECEKLKLSNPAELQAAIDGNRREGRRPGYGYDFSPIPTMIPPSPHLNGGLMNGIRSLHPPGPFSPGDEDHPPHGLPSPPPHLRNIAEREHMRAMEAAHHVMEEAKKRMEEVQRNAQQQALPLSKALALSSQANVPTSRNTSPPTSKPSTDTEGPPPPKRQALEEEVMRERFDRFMPPHIGMPSAHLKITSRNDGRSEFDNSLVVSMEVNGIMYQGVLFAQHQRRL